MPRIRRRNIFAIASVVAVVAGTLVGANVVSADSVWVQSYQRASQTEVCAAQPGETPWQASWGPDSSWSPSWEMWANNGNGGWTCTRSITWARSEVSARSFALGDIGPGGGLVFFIDSVSGLRYEMAPKTWGVNETTKVVWTTSATACYAAGSSDAVSNCQEDNLYPEGAAGQQIASTAAAAAVGMGGANTDAIIARMNAGSVASGLYAAGAARAYTGGGYTDWFLPSKDELNAMYSYSIPTGSAAVYGFASDGYWSSSQSTANFSWGQDPVSGTQADIFKNVLLLVRPVRTF